jgi:hypothetical protein
LFFLPFTWGRHRRARATTALPRATSLELLILFGHTFYSRSKLFQGLQLSLSDKGKKIVQKLASLICVVPISSTLRLRMQFQFCQKLLGKQVSLSAAKTTAIMPTTFWPNSPFRQLRAHFGPIVWKRAEEEAELCFVLESIRKGCRCNRRS